jgi:hypothetical protein
VNDSAWCARVVQARTEHDDLIPQRVWAFRKGREAAIDSRPVPGVGAEIVLTADGEWRSTRLFRAHEQAELSGAIADTWATLEARGVGMMAAERDINALIQRDSVAPLAHR